MNVRIISGRYGGRYLTSPGTSRTHPMSERVRGALFNMLGDIHGLTVLDAFAGTGALGFEALSRGAEHVTFIEKDNVAQKILHENCELLQVVNSTKIISASVSAWADTYDGPLFDLILIDPPYHKPHFSTVAKLVRYVQTNGLMVLSHPGRESASTVNGVVVVDKRSYGDAALAFYRRIDS